MKDKSKQQQQETRGPVIWTGIFIVLILCLSVANMGLLPKIMEQFEDEEMDLKGLTEKVQTTYTSEFSGKNYFIDINGLYYRITGRRILNNVMKLKNGMLMAASLPEQNMEPLAGNIAAFSAYLRKDDIPFLYVQAPFKMDEENLLLPDGREAYVNLNADRLLDMLREAGVNILDLRPYLSATSEMVEQNFFRTDHHWNYTGAFTGFQRIMETVQNMMSDVELDLTNSDFGRWESHTLKNWFLGSRGKQVGRLFAGVDDIVYYTPKFETYMSCAVPRHSRLDKGDFATAIIQDEYLENVDYFEDSPYNMYIGGGCPLVQNRNYDAPNNLKILMIKDSYTLPVQAYMSTLFREIDVVDPRNFTECSITEYAENMQPDIVIMMINPSVFDEEAYADFGIEAADERRNGNNQEEIVIEAQTVQLNAKDSNYNYAAVASGLEYNKTYIVRFDDVSFTQGESSGVTASLYNPGTKTVIATIIFDIEYCRENGGFEWRFNTPVTGDDNLQLLLYSGICRSTAGIAATYHNVQLSVLN